LSLRIVTNNMCAEVVQTAPNRLMTVLLNAGRNCDRDNVWASVLLSRINNWWEEGSEGDGNWGAGPRVNWDKIRTGGRNQSGRDAHLNATTWVNARLGPEARVWYAYLTLQYGFEFNFQFFYRNVFCCYYYLLFVGHRTLTETV